MMRIVQTVRPDELNGELGAGRCRSTEHGHMTSYPESGASEVLHLTELSMCYV